MSGAVGIVYIPAVNGLPGAETRHIDRLRRDCPVLDWRLCLDKDEVEVLLPRARAALVWAFHSRWSAVAAHLELVSTPAAGRELVHIDPRPGLRVCFGSFHGELMAETVAGMMLAFARGIRDCLLSGSAGWPRAEVGGAMRPVRGSHAVILGFGHIGKWIGKLLRPFGVRITGVNRADMTRPGYFTEEDRVIAIDRLEELLPAVDHLILALPGGGGTTGIIDARRLALLRPDAYLYNVGRGNAVDIDALAAALREGRIRGAGLDVYPEEPLPEDSPIRAAPNAMLLPHVSAFAPNYLDLYLDELSPVLEELFAGD
ncbi:MAG: D-2-hydroxyacid dehydrogenase [Planctomycetota bacterium]|jgi:phosphoglycerate dehydrogenase-like enzyme|nr:D-2-hydroxyacid dehydrogenase [Planctomycetota bacterium]